MTVIQTPVVQTIKLNGRLVNVHACPWPMYRKIRTADESNTMDIIEEVVRMCVTPCDDNPDDPDVINTSSRAQLTRLFEIAVSDEDGAKPDF